MKIQYRALAWSLSAFGAITGVTSLASAAVAQYSVNQASDFTILTSGDLLSAATPNPSTVGVNEGSSGSFSTLVDGAFGTKGDKTTSVTPGGSTVVTFTLTSPAADIKQLVTYSGWPDGGRDDQRYTVAYSTTADPATFIPIATVNNAVTPNSGSNSAQQEVIYDTTGADIASNVAALQFTFSADQENGYVGYREFTAYATEAFSTPEPASLGLLAIGGLGLLSRRRQRA